MNRNKQTEILGGIVTVIILLLLIFLSNVEVNKFSYLESVASSIINPVQRVFIDLRNKIQGNSAYFSNMEKKEAEKAARNITKNTTMTIPAHNIPAFKPAKVFVNEVK